MWPACGSAGWHEGRLDLPKELRTNNAIAFEAMTNLARSFGLRIAIALAIGLAVFQVLSWFPDVGIKNAWRVPCSLAIGLFLAGLVVYLLDRRRHI
jgi:hypothetical protein